MREQTVMQQQQQQQEESQTIQTSQRQANPEVQQDGTKVRSYLTPTNQKENLDQYYKYPKYNDISPTTM